VKGGGCPDQLAERREQRAERREQLSVISDQYSDYWSRRQCPKVTWHLLPVSSAVDETTLWTAAVHCRLGRQGETAVPQSKGFVPNRLEPSKIGIQQRPTSNTQHPMIKGERSE
jgi:hypothetical protein